MKRKNRVVLKVERFIYRSPKGHEIPSFRFVEVYSSTYKVDCQNWIDRQLKIDPTVIYRIYVEDN